MKKITATVLFPVETIVLVADDATESDVKEALSWVADSIMESTSIDPEIENIVESPATFDDEGAFPIYVTSEEE